MINTPSNSAIVFVFSGHGSQWPRMGCGLLSEPAFRGTIERWDRAIERHAGWSLLHELAAPVERSRLLAVEIAQPAIVAVQSALAELWRARGVEAEAVVGYSIGDVSACCFAGVLSVEDAARVICRQGELLRRLSGQGRMLAVELGAAAAREIPAVHDGLVDVAVEGSPRSSVLSGDPAALEEVRTALTAQGVFCRWVATDIASHSAQVEGVCAELAESLKDLEPRSAALPIYAGLTGDVLPGSAFGAAYWAHSLREPVRLAAAVERLVGRGHQTFLEVSPHPLLLPMIREGLAALHAEAAVSASLRRGEDELATLVIGGSEEPALTRSVLLAAAPEERRRLLEDEILRLAAAVLRVPAEPSPTQPLVRSGLDSLGALEIRHRLEPLLGFAVSAAALLGDRTPRELSRELVEELHGHSRTSTDTHGPRDENPARRPCSPCSSVCVRVPVGEGPPLSRGQKALWFLHRLAPESPAYHVAVALRVLSPLDAGALERALLMLAARHTALRTLIHTPEGAPEQRIDPRPRVDFLAADAAGWTEAELDGALHDEAWRPFDLEAGPPVRAALFAGRGDCVLLLALHHAVADFWSLAVLVRELGQLYGEESGGPAIKLTALPSDPFDSVRRQEEMLAGPEGERLGAWWRGQLAGAPVLELPTDRPRPAAQTFRGASRSLRLDAPLAAGLRAAARDQGSTLFMALMTAFQGLLHRAGGQSDLLVGTPTAGRDRSELAGQIGYFVNPVVLRGDWTGDPSFAAALGRTRRSALAAFEHQEYPFPLLVERLQPQRDPSRSPLFQAMLILEQAPRPEEQGLAAALAGQAGVRVALGGLEAETVQLRERAAQFDLTLVAAEVEGTLAVALQYSTDLFDGTTALRLLAAFRALVSAAVAEPERPLTALSLLAPAERHQLLHEWNDSVADTAPDLCLHELIAAQAARTPDAVAMEAGGRALTYAAIEARSTLLARRLRALGVGIETRVAVCVDRSVDLPVALLGILKAGGAYMPLDSAYPAERRRLLLEDSGASLILTEEALLDGLPPQGPRRICLEQLVAASNGNGDDGCASISPDNLAYVLYTSGSTGRPKGVQITHRAVVSFLRSMARRPGITAGDTLLAVTTLCFDIAGLELFLPLIAGARVVLASRATASDPGRLAEALTATQATVMQATPATWRMLAASGWSPDPGLTILCGGEALPPELAAGLTARGAALWNVYGPTETTVWSSVHRVDRVDQISGGDGQALPIGRPIDNTALYVLDPRGGGETAPVGWEGELAIAGAGLSRGYLGQPDRTAERFVPDPWGAPGARLYRTGDRVRRLADGEIQYLGRADDQIKLRGFRIEPGEVEAHLARHPAVAAAVVDAPAADGGERRLTAWIVAKTALPSAGELRAFLLERLPEPMVPSLFVPLDCLPLTPNGKVDRRALPAPDGTRPDLVAPYAPPRGSAEGTLVRIWEQVLGLDRVGRDDNFFEAGGDSIRALQVVFQARREGLDLAPGDLFLHRTPAELATAAGRRPHPPTPPLPSPYHPPGEGGMASPDQERLLALGLDPAGIEDFYPLSPLQQGMLLHSLAAPGAGVYCQQLDWRLSGDLDAAVFLAAWRQLVQRHAVLRSGLLWEGLETPLQIVHRHVELPWQEHDWRHLPPHRQDEELAALRAADRAQGFDAARPPLLRFTLMRLDDHDFRFLWTHHHLLLDGWSLQILHAELLAAYEELAPHPLTPSPIPLPPPGRGGNRQLERVVAPLSRVEGGDGRGVGGEGLNGAACPPRPYRDYIAWLAAQDHNAAETFWRGALAGIKAPTEITPNTTPHSTAKREAHRTLPAAATAALVSWARRRQLTLNTLVQAAWAVLLARGSGEDDVLFGVTSSGRPTTLPGAESMVGLLINTLPLRVRVEAGAPLLPWLHRLQADQAAARRFEHCSLTDIQKWSPVAPPRPLFTSLLVFESYPRSAALRGGTLTLDDLRFTESTNYPVTVIVTPGEEVHLQVSHDPACLDGAAAERLLAHLAVLLAGFAAETAATPDLQPLLAEAERHQVLIEWNDTRCPLPAEPVLHQLFRAQAARTPAAVAVEHEGRSLTYRELDRQSDRLADRLLRCGVAPETRVAVCAERSLELVAALLGVLKAGAAYVPLDPSYPADRLAYLLADAGAPVLLAQGKLLANLPDSRARVLLLDEIDEVDLTDPTDRSDRSHRSHQAAAVDADQLAYVIYTSGSTGNPKGAMNTHRAIVNRLLWMQREYRLTAADAVLQKTPVSFDVSVWEVFWPLLTGARLVMARPGGHLDPAYLADTIAAAGITTVHFVPSMLPAFLAQPGLDRCTRLRRVICSGETLPPDLCRRALELLPAAEVHNLYGPTEAAVDVTFHACREEKHGATATVPIGRPIDNTRIVLLDRGGLPVPVGVPGELHIGGVNLARGYHGQPARTAASFVPDPCASRPGERLYKTGDLARLRPDGSIEHLGRIDHQVKVRGVRIEPGEIEAVLLAHPGLRAAVVTVREDAPGERRLVAYAVSSGADPSVAELRDLCRRRLPEVMVPSAFVFLAALPVTPNGKLDRAALPCPSAPSCERAAFVGPRQGIESTLAAIWQETLHVDRVGLHDSFFDLGGHSLLLFRVQGLVNERCGRRIAPLDLFRYPTIAALAQQLSGAGEISRFPAEREDGGTDIADIADARRLGRMQLARQRDSRRLHRAVATGGRP